MAFGRVLNMSPSDRFIDNLRYKKKIFSDKKMAQKRFE